MTPEDDALVRLLAPALGRPLRRVAAAAYLLDGRLAEEACELWLYFAGLAPIRLRGAPDGWSLIGDHSPPEPLDADELGEIVVRDVTRQGPFRASQQQPLQAAWLVGSTLDRGTVGLRFDFGGLVRPIVLNLGDHLWVSHRYPRDLFVEEDYVEVPLGPASGPPGASP